MKIIHSSGLKKILFALAVLAVLGLALPAAAEPLGKQAITVFGGRLTPDNMTTALFPSYDFQDHSIGGFTYNRRLGGLPNWLRVEFESMVFYHFGDDSFFEGALALVFRWTAFPWSKYISTSIAIGGGASYASDVPGYEIRAGQDNNELTGLLVGELTFGVAQTPVELVFRVHHRSTLNGTFGDNRESNFAMIGLRFRY